MATGRRQVAPGQTIDPVDWGNPVWDQSVNTFASPGDRDTQWPAPNPGAVCFTEDTATLWVRRANAWQRCLYGVELDHGTAAVDIRTTPTPTATVNFRTGSFTGTPHVVPIAASAGWVVQPTGVSATSAGFIARSVTGGTGSSTMTVYWHAMRRLF